MNDTVVADPLYTVPLRVVNFNNQEEIPELSLCYQVDGSADTYINLITDNCVSVNARYVSAGRFHIIKQIAIRAVDEDDTCHDILVDTDNACSASIDGVAVDGYTSAGISVRRFSERVRVTVPNCDQRVKLVMWVSCQEELLMGEIGEFPVRMIKFVVARGFNLQPTSHGILGQFWNVPVSVESLQDSSRNYKVVVSHPDSPARSFPALLWHLTWERERRQCLYAGTSNAAKTSNTEGLSDSVIEGSYKDYIVQEAFDTQYKFSRFTSTCT